MSIGDVQQLIYSTFSPSTHQLGTDIAPSYQKRRGLPGGEQLCRMLLDIGARCEYNLLHAGIGGNRMQLRLTRSLTFLTFCSVVAVAQTSAPQTPNPSETPSAVHRLFVEDQEDTKTIKDEATNAEYLQRVKVREKALKSMMEAGQITSGGDFLEAAFIFQHGDNADDCLFAHILAMDAMVRDRRPLGGLQQPHWTATCNSSSRRRYSAPSTTWTRPTPFSLPELGFHLEEHSNPTATASCPTRCGLTFAYRHWLSRSRT